MLAKRTWASRSVPTGCAFILAASWHAPAATAPVEQFAAIATCPGAPDAIALSYDNGGQGLLVSGDGGTTFQLICSAAMTESFRAGSPIAVTGTDVAVVSDDVLTTTCSYENDTGRVVRFGQNSDDEMCFHFVTCYPMGALRCGLSLDRWGFT
jgi:hypothetical protein